VLPSSGPPAASAAAGEHVAVVGEVDGVAAAEPTGLGPHARDATSRELDARVEGTAQALFECCPIERLVVPDREVVDPVRRRQPMAIVDEVARRPPLERAVLDRVTVSHWYAVDAGTVVPSPYTCGTASGC
jgi:hypothetical protein